MQKSTISKALVASTKSKWAGSGRWAGLGRWANKAGRLGQYICPVLVPTFLLELITELTFTARQAVCTVNQSINLDVYCLSLMLMVISG